MRCILLILDSAGIGQLPDASNYGDEGCNTLGNVAKALGGIKLKNFEKLGLGNIAHIEGVSPVSKPEAAFGKCAQVSKGKDTMTGHWEIMGIKLDKPFPTYPNGFSPVIIDQFKNATGFSGVLGNKHASGTEIINELGQEHINTGHPIVYTSADSVFQIAAHKDVINLDELYDCCKKAEGSLVKNNIVARVIARPFTGDDGSFQRTAERKDFTINPPENILDDLQSGGIEVIGIGKIADIFAGRAVSKVLHGSGNDETMNLTLQELKNLKEGFIFTNLSDFDTLWGHRNDVEGYGRALEKLDAQLTDLLTLLQDDDLLFIMADHGCDPTTPGTDHTREYVPLLVAGPKVKEGFDLGVRDTFADVGQTIARYFGVEGMGIGKSFLDEIIRTDTRL